MRQRIASRPDRSRRRAGDLFRAGGGLFQNHVFGIGSQPFQRPDSALVAKRSVGPAQLFAHSLVSCLDLLLIRVATLDDFLWQAVGRKQ